MIDFGASVLAALTAAGLSPQYAYPQDWQTAPVVSYWESRNVENEHADDNELTSSVQYTIDIWAKTPETTHAASAIANTAMQGLGFHRTACYDLFETEAMLHHRSMAFDLYKAI